MPAEAEYNAFYTGSASVMIIRGRCGKKSVSADFVCDKNSMNFYHCRVLQSTALEQHNGAVLGADYFICVRRIETIRF